VARMILGWRVRFENKWSKIEHNWTEIDLARSDLEIRKWCGLCLENHPYFSSPYEELQLIMSKVQLSTIELQLIRRILTPKFTMGETLSPQPPAISPKVYDWKWEGHNWITIDSAYFGHNIRNGGGGRCTLSTGNVPVRPPNMKVVVDEFAFWVYRMMTHSNSSMANHASNLLLVKNVKTDFSSESKKHQNILEPLISEFAANDITRLHLKLPSE